MHVLVRVPFDYYARRFDDETRNLPGIRSLLSSDRTIDLLLFAIFADRPAKSRRPESHSVSSLRYHFSAFSLFTLSGRRYSFHLVIVALEGTNRHGENNCRSSSLEERIRSSMISRARSKSVESSNWPKLLDDKLARHTLVSAITRGLYGSYVNGRDDCQLLLSPSFPLPSSLIGLNWSLGSNASLKRTRRTHEHALVSIGLRNVPNVLTDDIFPNDVESFRVYTYEWYVSRVDKISSMVEYRIGGRWRLRPGKENESLLTRAYFVRIESRS